MFKLFMITIPISNKPDYNNIEFQFRGVFCLIIISIYISRVFVNAVFSPLSCCLRFSMIPGVSTNVTRSRSLCGISIPTSFSRNPWPNFSSGEKERELSAAITMPSMVRNFSPCIRTVYSEVVGSAPEKTKESKMELYVELILSYITAHLLWLFHYTFIHLMTDVLPV